MLYQLDGGTNLDAGNTVISKLKFFPLFIFHLKTYTISKLPSNLGGIPTESSYGAGSALSSPLEAKGEAPSLEHTVQTHE